MWYTKKSQAKLVGQRIHEIPDKCQIQNLNNFQFSVGYNVSSFGAFVNLGLCSHKPTLSKFSLWLFLSGLAISSVAAACVLPTRKKLPKSMHLRRQFLRKQTPEATDGQICLHIMVPWLKMWLFCGCHLRHLAQHNFSYNNNTTLAQIQIRTSETLWNS